MSKYAAKRRANIVPHYYDRNSRNFGFIDPRAVPKSLTGQAIDRAYQRAAVMQSWRDQEIVRKVVRRG